MSTPKKYYVVWEGFEPGVYTTWAECEAVTKGYTNAKFKSFPTRKAAEKAYKEGPDKYWGTGKFVSGLSKEEMAAIGKPVVKSLCVDAAWNSETKVVEYRGVWFGSRKVAFRQGPFEGGTNNIGEFLAIVHALGVLANKSLDHPVYSDSQSAMKWVKQRKVESKSMQQGKTSAEINALVERALVWLDENKYGNEILKWETRAWGEIPADYGRK
jgi:ribonuclease HI